MIVVTATEQLFDGKNVKRFDNVVPHSVSLAGGMLKFDTDDGKPWRMSLIQIGNIQVTPHVIVPRIAP